MTTAPKSMSPVLQKTPLHDVHVGLGGRMVDFAGWRLPLCFAGITREHLHTRSACSVFDVSHMGRLTVRGPDTERFLNRICTRRLANAEQGRSYYTHICREDGGVLDDVIVSPFEEYWGIVCNASNRDKIVAWLQAHADGFDVELGDRTTSTAMLAIQGPKAMELTREITGKDLSSLKRFHFVTYHYMMMRVVVYRSGYTGEDGLEVVVPAGAVRLLTSKLFGTRSRPHPVIKPAGLGARDTLRIEAAMPLYGHELTEDVDSFTAGQGWCVDLSKDFIGASAMRAGQEEGLTRKLIGVELDGRRIARQDSGIFDPGGVEVGKVTSGTLSPSLGKSIAMGFVSPEFTDTGTMLEIEIGGNRMPARVVALPFYKRAGSK